MALSPIQNNYATAAVHLSRTAAGTAKEEETAKSSSRADRDTFVKSADSGKTNEAAPKRLTAEQLSKIQEQQEASFQKMLTDILTTQADKANIAENGINSLNAGLFSKLVTTPEQQAAALQAISDDGEWGVNAVATRIMDMAVSLSGGDSSKASSLRAAVEKGFKQAGLQWGQKLPSICQDTHDEIEKRFDYWEENGTLDGYGDES